MVPKVKIFKGKYKAILGIFWGEGVGHGDKGYQNTFYGRVVNKYIFSGTTH